MFIIRLLSRITHICCAMIMLLLAASPLLSKPDKDGVISVHISNNTSVPLNTAKLGMILFVLSVLSGLLNSHFFNVGTTIPDKATRLRWRMHIYFLKGMMTLSLSPLLEVLLDYYFEKAGLTKVSAADKRQTAAVTRCYVTLMLAAIGSYCKLLREDAGKLAKAPAAGVQSPVKKVDASTESAVKKSQ
jgi:hypothetical protein